MRNKDKTPKIKPFELRACPLKIMHLERGAKVHLLNRILQHCFKAAWFFDCCLLDLERSLQLVLIKNTHVPINSARIDLI